MEIPDELIAVFKYVTKYKVYCFTSLKYLLLPFCVMKYAKGIHAIQFFILKAEINNTYGLSLFKWYDTLIAGKQSEMNIES